MPLRSLPIWQELESHRDQLRADHTRQSENQDADKYLVSLKGGSSNCDHETDSGGRGIKLADHDTDDRSPKAQSQTGKNERDR